MGMGLKKNCMNLIYYDSKHHCKGFRDDDQKDNSMVWFQMWLTTKILLVRWVSRVSQKSDK